MDADGSRPTCLVCGRTSGEVPLLTFAYRDGEHCICPQHLPMLIHSPARLADVLPGADGLKPSDHHD